MSCTSLQDATPHITEIVLFKSYQTLSLNDTYVQRRTPSSCINRSKGSLNSRTMWCMCCNGCLADLINHVHRLTLDEGSF